MASKEPGAGPVTLPDPPLGEGRIVLRRSRPTDIPRVVEACRDAETRRWIPLPDPYTEASAQEWLAGHEHGFLLGRELTLIPADRGDDRLLGAASLVRPDRDHAVVEIGYWVHPAERGRGVAVVAARLLARWAFALGYQRVELLAGAANIPSRLVAERSGFTYEGTKRSAYEVGGRRIDLALYAILPGEAR